MTAVRQKWRKPPPHCSFKACRCFLFCFLILLLLVAFSPAWSQEAQEPPSAALEEPEAPEAPGAPKAGEFDSFLDDFIDREEPILIESDGWIEYSEAADLYQIDGGVIITQGELRLEADHVTLDMANKQAQANGNVWLTNSELTLAADSVDLEMDTETGVIVNGQFVVTDEIARYYVSGDRISKIGENRYLIVNGGYTTCDCGRGTPSWRVRGTSMDMTLNGYGLVRNALFYWWRVPILYTPYAVIPVKVVRQTGFLMPIWSYSELEGFQADLPFFWALGDHVDATIYTNYIQKRGIKEGLEFRYAIYEDFFGEFDVDAIQDNLYGNKPGEFRWDVTFLGRWRIWNNLEVRHDMNLVSDRQYVVDFDQDIRARYDRYLRSTAIVSNRWERFSLNATSQTYQDLARDDNAYTFQRAPDVTFSGMTRPLVDPLLFRFDVEALNFTRGKIETYQQDINDLVEEPVYYTDGERISVRPELLLPWNIKQHAILTPRAGLIETAYYLQARDDEPEDHWELRHTYFLELDLNTEFQRIFSLKRRLLSALKHSIIPGLAYRYQAEPAGQDDNPIFDGFDRLARENLVSAYVYNRLWARAFSVVEQKWITLKLIDLRITQDFDIEEVIRDKKYEISLDYLLQPQYEKIERRPLRDLRFDLRAVLAAGFFIDKLLLKSEINWNTYDLYLSRANAFLGLTTTRDDTLIFEYRYRTDAKGNKAIQSIVGSAEVRVVEPLSLLYQTKYSFLDNRFIENTYGIHYFSLQNCWDLLLTVEDRTKPQETTIRLLMNLTGLVELAGSQGW